MKRYVLGFIIDNDFSKVLLIHKLRPAWQNGLINGIGGKVEPGEEWIKAIVRETKEETDLLTTSDDWIEFAVIKNEVWEMHVFYSVYDKRFGALHSMTDEGCAWYEVRSLPANVILNLRWQIPMAVDFAESTQASMARIAYNKNKE